MILPFLPSSFFLLEAWGDMFFYALQVKGVVKGVVNLCNRLFALVV